MPTFRDRVATAASSHELMSAVDQISPFPGGGANVRI